MNPRPYQRAAAEAAVARARETGSALVVLPTGTGKSIVMRLIARMMKGPRGVGLVLAHRGLLLDQLARHLTAAGFVCEREQGGSYVMAGQMRMAGFSDDAIAVLGSTDTLRGKRLKRLKRDTFDWILVDEAHRATAATREAIIAHFDCPVIGLTASGGKRGLAGVFGDSPAYSMGLADAIDQGWLVPIRAMTIACSYDVSALHGLYASRNPSDAALRERALPELLGPVLEHARGHRLLSFLPDVASAKAAAEHLRAVGRRCGEVWGAMPDDLRDRYLGMFERGDLDSLTSCGVLTEGYDVPAASAALLRATKSSIVLGQQAGRVLRPPPDARIDDATSASERRERIAASSKPHALLFVPRGTRAALPMASVVALMRGRKSKDDAAVERQLANGPLSVGEAVDAAERERLAAEREAAKLNRERDDFEAELRRRDATRASMDRHGRTAEVREVDPRSIGEALATDAQKRKIYRVMIQRPPPKGGRDAARAMWREVERDNWSKRKASQWLRQATMIDKSYRQARAKRGAPGR